ncbi:hypothetical protein ACFY4I_39150 [Streptomyces scabiei]|uniref:hypothetical protein n=1 Tax=Streptomyces scabiei TaxID=1930 RepID=UPI0036A1E622
MDATHANAKGCGNKASWRLVWFAPPSYQKALLSYADPPAITRSATQFEQTNSAIDKRMASTPVTWLKGAFPTSYKVEGRTLTLNEEKLDAVPSTSMPEDAARSALAQILGTWEGLYGGELLCHVIGGSAAW